MPLACRDVLYLQRDLPAARSGGKHVFAKSSEQKHKGNRHLQRELAVSAIFSIPLAQFIPQVNTQWQSYASQLAKLFFQ